MTSVNNLLHQIDESLKKTNKCVDSIEIYTRTDKEKLTSHLSTFNQELVQEQGREVQLTQDIQKAKEQITESNKKLSVDIKNDLKNKVIYFEEKQKILVQRVQDVKDRLRYLEKFKKSSMLDLGVPDYKQTRRDQMELLIYMKYTQMEISTSNEEEIKFTFYALNEKNPNSSCTIGLHISDTNEYKVTECSPHLEKIYELSRELNKDRDLYSFLKQSRQAFINSIVQLDM